MKEMPLRKVMNLSTQDLSDVNHKPRRSQGLLRGRKTRTVEHGSQSRSQKFPRIFHDRMNCHLSRKETRRRHEIVCHRIPAKSTKELTDIMLHIIQSFMNSIFHLNHLSIVDYSSLRTTHPCYYARWRRLHDYDKRRAKPGRSVLGGPV